MSEILAANLVHFVRYLRAKGLSVVPETSRHAAAAIETVGLARREDLYHALRGVTTVRPNDFDAFDEAFELFFGSGRPPHRGPLDEVELKIWDRGKARALAPVLASTTSVDDGSGRDDIEDIAGGSPSERLARKDFADLDAVEREEVRRMMATMIWRPADAASRRWRPDRGGPRPDLRRTLRTMVRPEGDLIPLAARDRRPRRRPLVVLADISGSMERYTEMFLHFIHAAQGRLGRVEAFVFSTHLTRITRPLRHRRPDEALRTIGGLVTDWAGGTRIGEAFRQFNVEWSRRVTRGGPIALVISDGWDTGDPALLERETARLTRSVHRLIWLNPLASRPGFEPLTRGLVTVAPYVDDFLSASSVLDLREVVRLLETVPAIRRRTA